MRRAFTLCMSLLIGSLVMAQDHELKSTTEVYKDLAKLERGLRVLYLAAHPDDENTRLISWLENSQHIETAYLSLTRGQGGQNLIGDEKGDGLGVIRTYELLEARKVDGGEQFFTRAVDFGYSKSATESFAKWGREEVLSDVIYVIRKFRPHVIITRFPPTRRAGHGHHEASAILAEEAFEKAGMGDVFPEQFEQVQPWRPMTLYFNSSSWWRQELDTMTVEQLRAEKIHRVNIGEFDPLTGLGINEIASLARSKHRCQAFGTSRDRGERFEYLQLVKGDWTDDLFESMKGMWYRAPEHKAAIRSVIDAYDFTDPAANLASVNQLIIPKISQRSLWAEDKDIAIVREQLDAIRQNLLGVRLEVYADKEPVVAGEDYPVTVEAYNAGKESAEIRFKHTLIDTSFTLEPGKRITWKEELRSMEESSCPYWLRKPHGDLYVFGSKEERGLAQLIDEQIPFTVKAAGDVMKGSTTVHRRWRDRSIGEIEQPMLFVPALTVTPSIKSMVIPVGQEMQFEIEIVSHQSMKNCTPGFQSIPGWEIEIVDGGAKALTTGQAARLTVKVKPGADAKAADLMLAVGTPNGKADQMVTNITYDHIPNKVIHEPAKVRLVPLNLDVPGGKVLYIEGSGDEVDEAMELIGYEVDRRSLSGITVDDLQSYKAVVTGIRAYNRNDDLKAYHPVLMNYVQQGGNMIVMYNTTYDLKLEQIGPYPLQLSRERVTEEGAKANLLKAKHPVFNTPNAISQADFDGWVQERGLYFAGEWDKKYTPLIAWRDSGEEEDAQGGLLVSDYGSGHYFYTGISFFRELPAGVPGAYRLFVNMIEYQP